MDAGKKTLQEAQEQAVARVKTSAPRSRRVTRHSVSRHLPSLVLELYLPFTHSWIAHTTPLAHRNNRVNSRTWDKIPCSSSHRPSTLSSVRKVPPRLVMW
jgi:hypothetical protein